MTAVNTLKAIRNGQLMYVEMDKAMADRLCDCIYFTRRVSYYGRELRKRKNYKAKNPHLNGFNPKFEIVKRKLLRYIDGHLVYTFGIHCRVARTVKSLFDLDIVVQDNRNRGKTRADFTRLRLVPGFSGLRHGQAEVLKAIDTHECGIIDCPTGFGKSYIIALLTMVYNTSRIAVVVSGVDLVESLHSRINDVCYGQCGMFYGKSKDTHSRIIVVSLDSLENFSLADFDIVLFDECHELGTDKRAAAVFNTNSDARFFGFSASPTDRADGSDVQVESIVGPVICHVGYEEAKRHGVVAGIKYLLVDVPGDAESPGDEYISSCERQDLKKRKCYWDHDHRNRLIAKAVVDASRIVGVEDPQILIMVETIDHVYQLKRLLPDFRVVYSGPVSRADVVKKENSLRRRGLLGEYEHLITKSAMQGLRDKFENGEIRKVIATYVWKQGIDARNLDIFIRADGSASDIHNIQQPGRLSRVRDGKAFGLLVDFNDRFNQWARRRAQKREAMYKKAGHERITV